MDAVACIVGGRVVSAVERLHGDDLSCFRLVRCPVSGMVYAARAEPRNREHWLAGRMEERGPVPEHLRADSARALRLVDEVNSERDRWRAAIDAVPTLRGSDPALAKRFGGVKRGRIREGMSAGSRKRGRWALSCLMAGSMAWILSPPPGGKRWVGGTKQWVRTPERWVRFLSMTHGEEGGLSAAASRRQLEELGRRLEARLGGRLCWFGCREWQQRGAVHWHLIVWGEGCCRVEFAGLVAQLWVEITGCEGSEWADRMLWGTRCDEIDDERNGLVSYLGAEFTKKAQQTVPEGEEDPGSAWVRRDRSMLEELAAFSEQQVIDCGRSELAAELLLANLGRTDRVPYAQLTFFGSLAEQIADGLGRPGPRR